MLQQIIQTFFKSDRKKVTAIISDIAIFYSYIKNNGQLGDDWHHSNLFPDRYWLYLQSYNWMNNDRESYLHHGVMNFILFTSYQYLDGKGSNINSTVQNILVSLYAFSPQNEKTKKLRSIVIETLIMVKRKKQGDFDIESHSEIFKSITWTLQNTILNMENQR